MKSTIFLLLAFVLLAIVLVLGPELARLLHVAFGGLNGLESFLTSVS